MTIPSIQLAGNHTQIAAWYWCDRHSIAQIAAWLRTSRQKIERELYAIRIAYRSHGIELPKYNLTGNRSAMPVLSDIPLA